MEFHATYCYGRRPFCSCKYLSHSKSNFNMKTLTLLLMCCVFSVSLGWSQTPEYSFKENYDLSGPAQLKISSADGNIDVVAGNGKTAEVLYIVRKHNKLLKIDRKELEKELTVTVVHTGNSLEIAIKYPKEFSFNSKDRMRVDFVISVPKETSCDLHTSDGNIVLAGLTSNQQCKTSDGNLNITAVMGNVIGKTSDGNIEAREITGTVDVRTSDGNIVLENIQGDAQSVTSDGNIALTKVNGDISVSTSDGDISFRELSGSLKASSSDGNIRGSIVGLKKSLIVRTSDGNIDVTIPNKLGLDLDIKGESLNVPLANFSGTSDEKYIHGKMNGGGIVVNLSSEGNVSLAYQ